MKKLFSLLAILMLAFTACEQPTDPGQQTKLPSLTIKNESSFILSNVRFSGIFFSTTGSNDLLCTTQSVKQLTENDINKAGYITFVRKDIGITLRTEALSVSDQNFTFTFIDNTPVEEQTNSSNKSTLSQISFLSQATVERGGLSVSQNDSVNLGEMFIDITKENEFTLKNKGTGKLLLTGNEPIKITDDTASVFSVIQPSRSEIAANSSLPFKINFTPKNVQTYTSTVTITSNDKNSPYTFTITAVGTPRKPVASVFFSNTEISQNGTINAGDALLTKVKNIEITIKNTGAEPLTIETANIDITGTNEIAYTKSTNPSGTVSMGSQTSFFIECKPTEQGENNAILTIPTNDNSRNPIIILLRTFAREARNEARLSGLQFTLGSLNPNFNANINSYDLRINSGPTVVKVKPTSMDSNVSAIKVNGVSQASGDQSHDIILASTNTVTIIVTAEDETTAVTYTVNIKIIKTWEKLYGSPGKRYGILHAISNGEGGIYASGYISNNEAALFNFDQNGERKNTFSFSSFEGTVGPTGIGTAYNDYFSVYKGYYDDQYYITKSTSPAIYPNTILTTSTLYNNQYVGMVPIGIEKNSNGYYFVAGNAYLFSSGNITQQGMAFINRHYSDGSCEKGKVITLSTGGITANSYWFQGMELLSNGDVLLYGKADKAGKNVAFACAINVSAANADSWNVRWSNIYEITNKASEFTYHFTDNSSNIILFGVTDDGGFIEKFPMGATTAAAAKPAGWPKTINGNAAAFWGGSAISDNSGYILVGEKQGTHGGTDVWVVKTDTNAVMLWEKFFGGTGDDWGQSVIEQTDGFVIVGATLSPVIAGQNKKGTEDIYILKINKDGTMD